MWSRLIVLLIQEFIGLQLTFCVSARRCRWLAIIKLSASDLGVGVDEGLMIDPANALQIADIERVLGAAMFSNSL
jgi:hypothetical protein